MVSTLRVVKRKSNAVDADSQRGRPPKRPKVKSRYRSRSLDSLDSAGPSSPSSPQENKSAPRGDSSSDFPFHARTRSYSLDSIPETITSSPGSHAAGSPTSRSVTPERLRTRTSRSSRMNGVVVSANFVPLVPTYRVFRNEVAETQDLDVPGEAPSVGKGLPVRNLDDFTFYDPAGSYLSFSGVAWSILSGTPKSIRVSGIVSRHLEDSDDGDSDIEEVDNELLVSLQAPVDFWTDYNTGQPETVWVSTSCAWYILRNPAPLYSTFYQPFWVAHHLTWLIAKAARSDKSVSLEDFCDSLQDKDDEAISIMGRELLERDLDGIYVTLYIMNELSSVDDAKLLRLTPLVQHLARRAAKNDSTLEDLFEVEGSDWEEDPDEYLESTRSVKPVKSRRVPVHQTVTMPLVHELTTGIFLKTLIKAGKTLDSQDRRHKLLQAPESPNILHPDSPTHLDWEDPVPGASGYFRTISLDGEAYSIGDVIMVKPGEDDLSHRAKSALESCSRSPNELVNEVWFCRIIHMRDESRSSKTSRTAHVQWYQHGSKTILQETAHPYGLFSLAECGDIPVGAILGRCTVQHLKPGDAEPYDYHCSFLWDADEARFLDQSVIAHQLQGGYPCCPCCEFNAKREQDLAHETFIHSHDHATVCGVDYHKNDFVYIAAEPNAPYLIGQIRRFHPDRDLTVEKSTVELTRLGRYDDVAEDVGGPHVRKDEARLFMTDQVVRYRLPLLEGKCFMKQRDNALPFDVDWTGLEDHFYVDRWAKRVNVGHLDELSRFPASSLAVCKPCARAAHREQGKAEQYAGTHEPLRAMELFAGAGGLSTGLEQSGFTKTRWAVELSAGAAATFQANHPDAVVFCQDTNACLQNAIDVREGKSPTPLRSLATGKELPPMPRRGEVDIIAGGFPCQSFSGMNHQRHKRPDDIRTTLVANMLSYVELYRPRYVLMENVKGLLHHCIRGGGSEVEEEETDNVIKMGIVKFVLRALTCLGYQATLRVLQAADYGSPQRRERVIFWGAQRSDVLPEYPLPTHVAPGYRGQMLNLPTYDKLSPALRSDRGCAPHRALVIADAISDLPGYDWKNPHVVCPVEEDEPDHKKVRRQRYQERSAVLTSTRRLAGFPSAVAYATKPRTTYQHLMRGDKKQVTLHCSQAFTAPIVERVWHTCGDNVQGPEDIPRDLWTPVMIQAHKRNQYKRLSDIWQNRFSRLQWDEPFNTALTRCTPFTKGAKVLHPKQKRIITARECARSQGFPDSYEFVQSETDNQPAAWVALLKDIYKQIGNAVPVPLAHALGKSLGKVLVKRWLEQGEREVTASMDQDSDRE